MEKFTAKLRSIQETKFPIVKAAFKGKDGQIYIGVRQLNCVKLLCRELLGDNPERPFLGKLRLAQ